jgi:hypothetical protein
MSNRVDPKHFRKRFLSIIAEVFDAADEAERANTKMAASLMKLHAIAGQSFAAAVHELATEPRRVCSTCQNDFMASDTGRDICAECVREERRRGLIQD